MGTALAVWFLFIYSPPKLKESHGKVFFEDHPFALHLVGAYIIYLACIHNTIMTPSCLDGKARPYHVYVGRIGLIAGFVGFGFGAYCAWSPQRAIKPSRGFAIGITIGGVFQILGQVAGYLSIRKYKALKQRVDEIMGEIGEESMTEQGSGKMSSSVECAEQQQLQQKEQHEDRTSTELDDLKSKRDKALKEHIILMVVLFVVACGMPA